MPVALAPRAVAGVEAAMEIVVGAVRVRVGPGFDSVAMRRLLEVLERAC